MEHNPASMDREFFYAMEILCRYLFNPLLNEFSYRCFIFFIVLQGLMHLPGIKLFKQIKCYFPSVQIKINLSILIELIITAHDKIKFSESFNDYYRNTWLDSYYSPVLSDYSQQGYQYTGNDDPFF